jgi:hypothetical protein
MLLPYPFVQANEFAESDGKQNALRREWINAKPVLKPRYDNGKAERIEPTLEKRQIVVESRKVFSVFPCNSLECVADVRSDVHRFVVSRVIACCDPSEKGTNCGPQKPGLRRDMQEPSGQSFLPGARIRMSNPQAAAADSGHTICFTRSRSR